MAAGQATSGRFAAQRRLVIVKTQSAELIRSISLLRSSPALVVLAIAAATTINFADPDLWRHLLVGRIILQSGHIPVLDTFSYTAFGQPWRQHEWLAQTIMALCYSALGAFGLKLLKLACGAATISLLAIGIAETGAPARVQRPVLILIALVLAPQMQYRPQLFTYVLLAGLFALLAAETYHGSSKLWVAIPAFALWANLHGGFVAGLGAMGLYACVVGALDLAGRRGLGRGLRLAAITAGCALATLANPLGVGVWFNVMHSLTNRFVKQSGAEWAPLLGVLGENLRAWSPGAAIYIVPILLFAAFAICFLMAPAIDDAALTVVGAAFALGAFYAVRNIPLAAIAVAIPLTRHAGLIALKHAGASAEGRDARDGARGFSPTLAIAGAVMLAWAGGMFSTRLRLGFDYPKAAVAFMKEHRLSGNILCQCLWGEYVTWHLGPASKVFMDGRLEQVYPQTAMEDYVRFEQAKPGAGAVLDDYRNDFVLVPPNSKSSGVVMSDEHWQAIYQDSVAVLFARAPSPLAQNANQSYPRPAAPDFFP